jgi:gas vesicle protein
MLCFMSLWESLRSWFRSEADSGRELADDLKADWSADLDRKEAELAASPKERIDQLQDQISDNSSAFDEIKTKIESADPDSGIEFTDPE